MDRREVAGWAAMLLLLVLAAWWGVIAWSDCRTDHDVAYCLWSMG